MQLPDPDDEDGHDCAAFAIHLPEAQRRCTRCGSTWTADVAPPDDPVKFRRGRDRGRTTVRDPRTGEDITDQPRRRRR